MRMMMLDFEQRHRLAAARPRKLRRKIVGMQVRNERLRRMVEERGIKREVLAVVLEGQRIL